MLFCEAAAAVFCYYPLAEDGDDVLFSIEVAASLMLE
jgi:hypothetical protein